MSLLHLHGPRTEELTAERILAACDALAASFGYDTWEQFCEDQTVGDCMGIAYQIEGLLGLPQVAGEVKTPQAAEIGWASHWWNVDGNGQYWDFAKGTLRNVVPAYVNDFDPQVHDPSIYYPA